MRKILACFCLLAMPACVPPQHDLNAFTPYNFKTAFSPADFLPFEGEGGAAIHGQAFLRTTIGEVRTCAGQDVTLLPGTAYNTEFFSAQDQGFRGARINRDAAADKYSRKGICDAQGTFAFNHLPVGNWIIAANVGWDVPGSYGCHQGGLLRQPIDAKAGANDLILTDRDLMR